MNIFAALQAFIAVTLVSSAVQSSSRIAEEPRFDFEIRAGERGPFYTVTNQTSKIVTACVVKFSSSSVNKDQGTAVWDSLLMDELPIEPRTHMSGNLPHVVGGLYPDKVEVIAGIWADGDTFGQPEWVKIILRGREMQASAYEQAANLLQRGLDQNWTSDQFLQALNEIPNSIAVSSLRSTLKANQNAEKARILRHLLLGMLDTFTGKYERIRKAKPTVSGATNSYPLRPSSRLNTAYADLPHLTLHSLTRRTTQTPAGAPAATPPSNP